MQLLLTVLLCIAISKFLSHVVNIAISRYPNSIVSHSALLSTSLNKISCLLSGPVDFAQGSGDQHWFSYLGFVILLVALKAFTLLLTATFSFFFSFIFLY